MTTYIALFRGINVGGRNSLPMKDLRDLLGKLGAQNVRTYIQSGNVAFRIGEIDGEQLSESISQVIDKQFGFRPKVLLLQQKVLEQAIAGNPYPEAESEPKSLHFYFLASEPENPDLDQLAELKKDNERFTLKGSVFYLHAPDGIGRSKLAERSERALGVPATARNWRTVSKIMEMVKEE